MSFAPLHGMEGNVLEVSFAEALAALQGLLRRRILSMSTCAAPFAAA
jgi:hypothetical protein